MKNRFLFLMVLLCFGGSIVAQTTDSAVELKGLDEFVNRMLEEWKVPGVGIAIVKGDEVVLSKGYGLREVEAGLPVDENTLFAIGSSSKAFTAATVCMLADDGILSLDEPVLSYLPDFKLFDAYAAQKMTPRDLLSHRSGLPRHDLVWYGSSKDRAGLYQSLVHLEPTASFRGAWQYQNLMFMTAGYLVERLTGSSLEAFTKERIFDPLEMTTAGFSVDMLEAAANAAAGYGEENEQLKRLPYRNIDAIGPAGSINASPLEMANWVIAQLNEGKFKDKQVISAAMVKEMHKPNMIVSNTLADEYFFYSLYAMGWFVTDYRGVQMVQHGGNIDGFSAMVALAPDEKFGMVILTNKNGTPVPGIIRNHIFDLLSGQEPVNWHEKIQAQVKAAQLKSQAAAADEVRVPDTRPSHNLEAYTGNFEHPAYGAIRIELADDSLHILHPAIESGKNTLEHYHYDLFTVGSGIGKLKVQFLTSATGQIDRMTIPFEAGLDPIVFTRKASMDFSRFAGEYVLVLSELVTRVSVKDGQLKWVVPGQMEYTLEYVKDNLFSLKGIPGFTVKFAEEAGNITGLESIQPNGTFAAVKKK